jgi:L-iditol 2-dehydrogenase
MNVNYAVSVILGHEFASEIVEVGPDVSGFAKGDKVTALPFAVTCGRCRYCLRGHPGLCAARRSFGSGVDGAFAPYMTIPVQVVRRLPHNIDFYSGTLAEPLACCVKAARDLTSIRAGDVVLVTGPGTTGLLMVQLAKISGATVIVAGTDVDVRRLQLAGGLGADYALREETDDLDAAIRDLTSGEGVDVLIECSGVPAAVRKGMPRVRKQGQIVQLGLFGKPFELDYERVAYNDLKIAGSFGSSISSRERALVLLERELVRVAPLISDILSLSDWAKGFEVVRHKEGLKVLLDPARE